MRGKDKLIIGLLMVVFVLSAGMFVYQNFLSSSQVMKNYEYVIVTKEDLADGAVLTRENVGIIPVPKGNVLNNYITDFKEVENKVLKGGLMKNEIITTGRVEEAQDSKESLTIIATPANAMTVKAGEAVNVYVQLTESKRNGQTEYKVYEIVRDKVVQDVTLVDKSTLVESLKLNVTEDEALAYYRAQYLESFKSRIIIVPQKDVVSSSAGAENEFVKASDFKVFLEEYAKQAKQTSTTN